MRQKGDNLFSLRPSAFNGVANYGARVKISVSA
jgi:hypothetical protein